MESSRTHKLRPILASTDFSPASAAAVDYAAALAQAEHRRLHLVFVRSFLPLELLEVDNDALQQQMLGMVRSSAGEPGLEIAQCHIAVGNPAHEILKLAAQLQAKWIVTGTHGRCGFQRLALGSVAEALLRRSSIPVIVIGPQAKSEGLRPMPWKRILLACDVSAPISEAARLAGALAVEHNAQLTIFHVQPDGLRPVAEDLFETIAPILPEESWLKLKPHCLIRGGNLAEQISNMTADSEADLLVLSASEGNRLVPRLHRRTIAEILCAAHCPVLILRNRTEQGAEERDLPAETAMRA